MKGNFDHRPPPFLAAGQDKGAASFLRIARSSLAEGRLDDAIMNFQRSVELDPSTGEALNGMGRAFELAGNDEQAEKLYKRALEARPDLGEAIFALGDLFLKQGRSKESELVCRYGLSMIPGSPAVYNNLANALKQQGDIAGAEENYRHALAVDPDLHVALFNLGTLLLKQGRLKEAQECLCRLLEVRPGFAPAACSLGNVFMEQGLYEKAGQCYRKALALDPGSSDAGFDLAYLLLLQGDYREGLEKYELRLHRPEFNYLRTESLPVNSDLSGKTVLVRCEQGLGDTIHFVRFISELRQRCGSVIFECQHQLCGLLSGCEGVDSIIERKADLSVPDVDHDRSVALLSLPYMLGTTIETIPGRIPYINIDGCRIEKWKKITSEHRGNDALLIGMAWSGNKRYAGDAARSLAFKDLLPLMSVDGTFFYSLQYGEAVKETEGLPRVENLAVMTDQIRDFSDTAGLIKNLDLVITIDSVTAHLAGALGVPVWNLLPYVSDWRWMLEREDSAWYPTMRLFRQAALDDWQPVLERVRAGLIELRNTRT